MELQARIPGIDYYPKRKFITFEKTSIDDLLKSMDVSYYNNNSI